MAQIELSVAMIFKNEIRCLERCLKSLQPLRERFSMELVMADTGSDDGSRAVAEKYADTLFDFPWVNDFAAARNAVLDRCSGKWVLVVDCDEWLEPNLDEMESIVRGSAAEGYDGATVLIRNYMDKGMTCYSDFPAYRLMRLRPDLRYVGSIHEIFKVNGQTPSVYLTSAKLLHHDGYIMINDGSEAGKRKLERNAALLREELKKTPNDLRRWMQLLDCSKDAPDRMKIVRRAVKLIDGKKLGWEIYGAPILRRAVEYAAKDKLPCALEWAQKARTLFPDSYFTRIDVERSVMIYCYARRDCEGCLAPGEAYLRACEDYFAEKQIPKELLNSPLEWTSPFNVEEIRVAIADALRRLDRREEALARLSEADGSVFSPSLLQKFTEVAARLFTCSDLDMSGMIRRFWRAVHVGPEGNAMERKFLAIGQSCFSASESPDGKRPLWQMFLPLRGECVLGDYAAAMGAQTPEEADAALAAVEDLTTLPPAAFVHALKTGAAFPLPERELTLEQSDAMAAKLTEDKPFLREAALFAADACETAAALVWARSLALTAVKGNDWTADENPMALLRAFVKVESVFLPLCYTETALKSPGLLPPMQRFALHLVSAFAVLFPDAVSSSFAPAGERSVRRALAELKLAVIAAPRQKTAIDAVLDTLAKSAQ